MLLKGSIYYILGNLVYIIYTVTEYKLSLIYCVILLTITHILYAYACFGLLVVVTVLVSIVLWQLTTSLLRIIKCPIMSDQNMGWSDTMSDQVFRIILNSAEMLIKPMSVKKTPVHEGVWILTPLSSSTGGGGGGVY